LGSADAGIPGSAAPIHGNARQYEVPLPNAEHTERGRSVTAGEFAAISRIRRRLPGPPEGELWVGDDAAVLGPVPGALLFSTDMAVAGVHGDLSLIGVDDFGWRALAAAVIDIAAMGGRARHAVVAVAGPPSTDLDLLYEGLASSADAHGCPIVGGDLSGCPTMVVAVAVTGSVDDGPPAVARAGACSGDTLFVTGPLGAAAAGLRRLREAAGPSATPKDVAADPAADPADQAAIRRLVDAHRRPRARLAEGEVARRAGASAMVDVSDGLAADLGHLADASALGVALDVVPCAPGATLDDALGGGEDYELVIAAPDPAALVGAFDRAGLRPPLRMGVCVADPSLRTLAGGALGAAGWEHPFE
jgi:thiamine-monophosphate kinase